jgi:tetratricopeptide (TPR) repeat protein
MNKETVFSIQLSAFSMKRIWNFVVTAVVATVSIGWAPTALQAQSVDPIGQQIDSKDPAQIQQAVATIRNQLLVASPSDRKATVQGLAQQGHWLEKLKEAQQQEEIVRLAQEATLAVPWDVWLIEYVQYYRVLALRKLGKPQQALAVAKGLFNVCRMKNTANDLLLIVSCLRAAYPGDAAVIDRFRQEQTAGAELTDQLPTPDPSAGSGQASQLSTLNGIGLRSSVLDSVKIDGTPYDAAIQQYTGEDYTNLVARGNLLLLADRAKEARPVFERAYAVASDKDLAEATESIARCIRAEDGTIGRANAWLLSIRP